MRIISGKYRGKNIKAPSNLRSRPTTSFAKEGLFNILNNQLDFEGLAALDLFSGTGSISFELASRGADPVWAVDMERKSTDFIKRFCDRQDIPEIKVVRAEVYRFLKTCEPQFDLIFADPPYGHKHVGSLPEKVMESGVLREGGLLVVEHGPETDYSDSPYVRDQRKYGSVHFTFFQIDV